MLHFCLVYPAVWPVHGVLALQGAPAGRLHDHEGAGIRRQCQPLRDLAEVIPGA